MKRLVLALALVCGLSLQGEAQESAFNLRLTVTNSARSFADAASPTCTAFSCILQGEGHSQAMSAACVSTAGGGTFTYRVDGTTATTTEGIEVPPGATVVISGTPFLLQFSAIRTGASDASLRCVFKRL